MEKAMLRERLEGLRIQIADLQDDPGMLDDAEEVADIVRRLIIILQDAALGD